MGDPHPRTVRDPVAPDPLATIDGAVRWYDLTDCGREAALCLWAADHFRSRGWRVPARLRRHLAAAVNRWVREGAAGGVPRPCRDHLLRPREGSCRRRVLNAPGEVVRWSMAGAVCEARCHRAVGVEIPTLPRLDRLESQVCARHPVWQEEPAVTYRPWEDLSDAAVDVLVRLAAREHLRDRGFAVPDDLERGLVGAIRRWSRERDGQGSR